MFNLIRRISNGVILRPDRPWADDATSNAPTKGKKRRLDRNADIENIEEVKTKKIRGESDAPETPTPQSESQPASTLVLERQQQEEKEVKEVTKGVKEVELNESPSSVSGSKEVKPESVPLPREDDGEELEEGLNASPPLEAASDGDTSTDGKGEVDGPSEPEPKPSEGKGVEGVEEKKAEEAEFPEKKTKKLEPAH
ncbi:hypothetical protein J132_03057 [Termitomyces sp. J132]|nr:hypothetical protein H2248_003632 [Termitomyces sp. 'cryptogamus']KNZ81067.1 hypothetical protein J132_03057 [Termitomyces sp. J132]